MTDHDTKQDHPGGDWVEILGREGYHTRFFHPGLRHVVIWNDQSKADESRAEAVVRCRAISAAALHWERVKADEWTAHFHNPIIGLINDLRSR